MSNSYDWVHIEFIYNICDVLRDWLPFVQFKKRENTQREVILLEKLFF